jgi:DNA-binding MarR family transcriptional regulator
MGSHTSDDTTRVVTALRSLVQLLRAGAGEAERRAGLSSAQLFVLSKLVDAPAPSVNALAQRVHAHQSSVSVVVDLLVQRGLVRRSPDPTDRRRRLVELTSAGRTRLRKAPRTVQSKLVAAIAALPRRTRGTLSHTLDDIVRTLGAPAHPPLFLETDPRDR